MFRKPLAAIGLIGILLAIASCQKQQTSIPSSPSSPSPSVAASPSKVLVLGDISSEPIEKTEQFQPLADYLAANLEELGIEKGEVKIVPDFESMKKAITAGEIDLYFDSLYPAMIVSTETGAKPILRRWKGGEAEYNTVFITRADSNITSLEELRGKIIALEEEVSTSGYLLPVAYLLEAGLKPVEKPSDASPVQADEVGYVFSRDHENTIQWVLSGKVLAGALDNPTLAEIPAESRDQLTILAETAKVPRHLVLVGPKIEPAQQNAIADLLKNLDTTQEGPAILEQFEETKKFDEFPTETSLERMQQLYQRVQNQ